MSYWDVCVEWYCILKSLLPARRWVYQTYPNAIYAVAFADQLKAHQQMR
jgi:hypothetical protein